MLTDLLSALRVTGLTIFICAVGYPLGVLAIAAVAAPDARMGSLITDSEGRVVGSRLVAQGFARPEYFRPRPSAVDYNAASTGGSNYGPSNPDHLTAVHERLDAIVKDGSENDPDLNPVQLKQPPIAMVWSKFRGPGTVTFANARPAVEKEGKVSTTATFSAPGEYILRAQVNDRSGDGGGGFQCCWTNAHVKVSVAGGAATK